MSATMMNILQATEKSMEDPAVIKAAQSAFYILNTPAFSEEDKATAMFRYTAIVVSVCADNVSEAILGQEAYDAMAKEFEEIENMGENV